MNCKHKIKKILLKNSFLIKLKSFNTISFIIIMTKLLQKFKGLIGKILRRKRKNNTILSRDYLKKFNQINKNHYFTAI